MIFPIVQILGSFHFEEYPINHQTLGHFVPVTRGPFPLVVIFISDFPPVAFYASTVKILLLNEIDIRGNVQKTRLRLPDVPCTISGGHVNLPGRN